MSAVAAVSPHPVEKREVLAWALYDWANSAYSTLAITVMVLYLERVVFPSDGGSNIGAVAYAWGLSLSMAVSAVLSPIVGALADAKANKYVWLRTTAFAGAGCAMAMSFVPLDYPWLIWWLFVATSFFFELSLGVYNAFLPELADDESMNRVSAWGFALGYVGGGLALLVAIGLLTYGDAIGLHGKPAQMRAGLFLMGAWWLVFTIPAALILRDRVVPRAATGNLTQAVRKAIGEVGHTLGHIRNYRTLAWFLVGFLFYNDGVQTVLSQASTFATQELGFPEQSLVLLVLMIQFLALVGALFIGWVSDRAGQKPTLIGCLVVWIGLLLAAYFVHTQGQFWVLGAVVSLVMGGVQSVSRAIMGVLSPPEHSGEFFGFFNFSGKATSFIGTFIFGAVVGATGSSRLAIVSLLVQFVIGLAIVAPLRIGSARETTPQ